jgi:hypothetical protein
MDLSDLVIVADQGAGEIVRTALAEVGIHAEVRRSYPEHPYIVAPLAEPWQILVPAERLTEAKQVLARLEHEMQDEVEAQALAAGPAPSDERPRRR